MVVEEEEPATHCSTALTGSLEALAGPHGTSLDNCSFFPFCAGGRRHAWPPGRPGRPRGGMQALQSSATLRASHHKMFVCSAICSFWCQQTNKHQMFVGCKCSRLRCEQWLLGVSLKQIKAATVGVGEPLKPPFFPGISELTDFSNGFLDRQLTIGSKLSFVVTSTGRDVEVSSSRLFYPVATPRELPYKVTSCPAPNIYVLNKTY